VPEPVTLTVTTFETARDVYRQAHLRQALYDAGAVIMSDVLVNLHGAEHRARRRVENRLFRRATFDLYERKLFPEVIDATLAPYLADGHAELVHLGHQLMLNLSAVTAGVDRPLGTPEETARLHEYMMLFVEGATLEHFTGDKEALRSQILKGLRDWDQEFLQPSIRRRTDLLDRVAAGELAETELPRDVLTTLLRQREELGLSDDVILRETAFFLLAAAHTSATAFGRAVDHILRWCEQHPEDRARVREDKFFLQRCIHEMVRLNPSSPVAMRWAVEDVELDNGELLPKGSKVVVDLAAVNRDTSVFGPDAADFNPYREVPQGVGPFGLSFGAGMHVCIGQDLAAGVLGGDDESTHLFGLVTIAVQKLFDADVRFDPDNPAVPDATTKRPYWASLPVLLTPPAAASHEEPRLEVRVDTELCISSGKCVADEPSAFAFDDDEIAMATPEAARLPEQRLLALARNCPSGAIKVQRAAGPSGGV
jgi:cytochrome P450/ferredoxin